MAVTRIWKVTGRMEHPINYAKDEKKTENPNYTKEAFSSLQDVMDYASNPDKTEKQFFVSGINCNVSTAREQFLTVKKQYGKEGGIIAYHAYQSFAENEVTPELAHQIGVEFAKQIWGEEFQVVVATHLNTKCLHNHFVINSVSFKHGKRCRNRQWRELSKISDEICKQHELSIVENPLGKRLPYPMAMAEKEGKPTRLVMAKQAVDAAIPQSCNMHEFSLILKEMGYTCQFQYDRKYWTIKQKNWKRPIRLARLGEDYTNERIEERVRENPTSVRMMQMKERNWRKKSYKLPTREDKIKKVGGLKGLYLHYCYKLGYLPRYRQSPAKVHYLYRDDLLLMEQIAEETRLLVRNNIQTQEELDRYMENVEQQMQLLMGERDECRKVVKRTSSSEDQIISAKERIGEINETLKSLRKESRLCAHIATRSEKIEDKMKQENEEREKERRKERVK